MIVQTITINQRDKEPKPVKAFVFGPFALHVSDGWKPSSDPDDFTSETMFTLTHVASGYALRTWKTFDYFVAMVDAIEREQVDFSFTDNKVPPDTLAKMKPILADLEARY